MNSLLLPPEFTAISALNQMSNSSFSMNKTTNKEAEEKEEKSKSANGNKTSFFQKVLGASKK